MNEKNRLNLVVAAAIVVAVLPTIAFAQVITIDPSSITESFSGTPTATVSDYGQPAYSSQTTASGQTVETATFGTFAPLVPPPTNITEIFQTNQASGQSFSAGGNLAFDITSTVPIDEIQISEGGFAYLQNDNTSNLPEAASSFTLQVFPVSGGSYSTSGTVAQTFTGAQTNGAELSFWSDQPDTALDNTISLSSPATQFSMDLSDVLQANSPDTFSSAVIGESYVQLTFYPIPEPATLALFMLGGLGLMLRKRGGARGQY